MPQKEPGIHSGHRQRLKKRFLEEGLVHFEPHNVLELLLFFGIQQRDTNPLAHELLDKFGNFSKVLDAPYDELLKLKGMTQNAATLIKLFPEISRLYDISKNEDLVNLKSTADVVNYITPYFKGKTSEEFYAIFLDNACKVFNCKRISTGGLNSAPVSIRKIVETAIACNCTNVVVAHNHPHGLSVPSNADCTVTVDIHRALKLCEIKLLDHVIISPNGSTSLLENGYYHPSETP